jgi:hypothetical protein
MSLTGRQLCPQWLCRSCFLVRSNHQRHAFWMRPCRCGGCIEPVSSLPDALLPSPHSWLVWMLSLPVTVDALKVDLPVPDLMLGATWLGAGTLYRQRQLLSWLPEAISQCDPELAVEERQKECLARKAKLGASSEACCGGPAGNHANPHGSGQFSSCGATALTVRRAGSASDCTSLCTV